jgi:hypothetical protein
MKRPTKFPLKFEKGIIGITRKHTIKEALKAFESFLLEKKRERCRRKHGRIDESWVQRELRESLEMFRQEGFARDGFEFLRGEYAKMPRRAPRKKVKMKFDANGIPKVIKTTHAAEDLALIAYIKMTEIGPKVPKSRSKTP